MKRTEADKKGFIGRCAERLAAPSWGGIPLVFLIIVGVFYWLLTDDGLFREKDGALWFLYHYLPPPFNNVWLWKVIGPFLVGICFLPLYKYLDQVIARTREEVQFSPDSPAVREKVKRKAKIIGAVTLSLLVIILFWFGGEEGPPLLAKFVQNLPPPLSNESLWWWLFWVTGGILFIFWLQLKDILGEIKWKDIVKELTDMLANKQQEANQQANEKSAIKQKLRSFMQKFLTRLKAYKNKDKEN